MSSIGFISMPGGAEWLVIGFVGLLLFGKRLPEVAQSLGRSVTEFKKGLQGITSDPSRPSLPEGDTAGAEQAETTAERAESAPSPSDIQ